MKETLYDQSSILIAAILLILMAFAIEVGFRTGLKAKNKASKSAKEQVSAIQSSLLGILALMLGFTFSIALERFNSRSEAVVDEANAIGTAYLRSDLLPDSIRGEVQKALREYLSLRVSAGTFSLDNNAERNELLNKATLAQDKLWLFAVQASKEAPNPATTGLFVQSLNQMIDSFGLHIAELKRHVPELVLMLLYGSFIVTGCIIGFSAGIGGYRPAFASYIMVSLVALLMFMVVDLDRPRRGLIRINQESLIELNSAINKVHIDGKASESDQANAENL
jgi:hypothetical protein